MRHKRSNKGSKKLPRYVVEVRVCYFPKGRIAAARLFKMPLGRLYGRRLFLAKHRDSLDN